MLGTIFQADPIKSIEGFLFVCHAVEVLRQHDVLKGGEIWNQVELLKDKANSFGANMIEFGRAEACDVSSVEPYFTTCWPVEAANNIHRRAFAGTGWPHHGNPLAGLDGETYIVERVNQSMAAIAIFRSGGVALSDVLQSNHLLCHDRAAPKGAFYSPDSKYR